MSKTGEGNTDPLNVGWNSQPSEGGDDSVRAVASSWKWLQENDPQENKVPIEN